MVTAEQVRELIGEYSPEGFAGLVKSACAPATFVEVDKVVHFKEVSDLDVRILGVVKDLPGEGAWEAPLLVADVELKKDLTERSSRVRQFKLAKAALQYVETTPPVVVKGMISQGVFVFHDKQGNFRVSLVTVSVENGKFKWSQVKRQSFYVQADPDANATFIQRMCMSWASLKDIKEVFSVEKLTKEFYREIQNWYFWALKESQNIRFPNEKKNKKDDAAYNRENLIRLITRLLFTWFLKEKGLVNPDLFNVGFLKTILRQFDPEAKIKDPEDRRSQDACNYYSAVLQNLFFATFNQEIKCRAFIDQTVLDKKHYTIKNLYRNIRFFKETKEKRVMEYFAQSPFVNGGLFECLDNVEQKDEAKGVVRVFSWDGFSDGFRDQQKCLKRALIPNQVFFGSETTCDLSKEYGNKSAAVTKVRGIFETLGRFNFTVEENTPGDADVALDPELLGKVFENLLGAYNPETEEVVRKSTGSFYTPREIVDYMVEESLKNYLKTKVPTVDDKRLDAFFDLCGSSEEVGTLFTSKEKDLLIKALRECKILDPACGSGAFPMGALLKMTELLRLLRGLPKDANLYELKLQLIKNCIFGSDIQPIAVQISRLRFFISLLCEQKPNGNKDENYGIEPLPNLENNFVAADSLCSIDVGDLRPILSEKKVAVKIEKLRKIRDALFHPKRADLKKDLRRQDELLCEEIDKAAEDLYDARVRITVELLEKRNKELVTEIESLTDTDRVDHDEVVHHQMNLFGEEEPVIVHHPSKEKLLKAEMSDNKDAIQEALSDTKRGKLLSDIRKLVKWNPYKYNVHEKFLDPEWMFGVKDGFDIVIGNPPYISHDQIPESCPCTSFAVYEPFADIYCYFYERAVELAGRCGIVEFITSNSYLRTNYGLPLRQWLHQQCDILAQIDIEGSQVFESAIVNTVITALTKNRADANAWIVNAKWDEGEFDAYVIENRFKYKQSDFENQPWTLVSRECLGIKNKLDRMGQSLESLGAKIRLGVATGDNTAFLLSEEVRKELVKQDPKNRQIIKPVIRGQDIQRYCHTSEMYILLTRNGIDVKSEYPAVYDYLAQFGQKFRKRSTQGDHWTNLRPCAFFDDFKEEKLIWIELTDRGRFSYSGKEEYLLNSAYFVLPPKDVGGKYLLGILNSSTIMFYMRQIAATSGMGTLRWFNNYVKLFPIPQVDAKRQQEIETVVDQVLALKAKDFNADISNLEAKIDALVYKLYGLTEEEIAVVEQASGSGEKKTKVKGEGEGAKAEKVVEVKPVKTSAKAKREKKPQFAEEF